MKLTFCYQSICYIVNGDPQREQNHYLTSPYVFCCSVLCFRRMSRKLGLIQPICKPRWTLFSEAGAAWKSVTTPSFSWKPLHDIHTYVYMHTRSYEETVYLDFRDCTFWGTTQILQPSVAWHTICTPFLSSKYSMALSYNCVRRH
jgi:hypothetical protein